MTKHALPTVSDISMESVTLYDQHRLEAVLVINDFLLKYLSSLYQEFDGDIVLAIVLGELAHQNVTHVLSGLKNNVQVSMPDGFESIRDPLVPCNPLSISEATGIPRETVRRKFSTLLALGWIERISHNGYIITKLAGERFRSGFNLQLFEETRQLCIRLQNVLSQNPKAHPTKQIE